MIQCGWFHDGWQCNVDNLRKAYNTFHHSWNSRHMGKIYWSNQTQKPASANQHIEQFE